MIGIASAEMDLKNANAEITDFSALDEYRGKNIALELLKQLKKIAKKTLYNIARSVSHGIKIQCKAEQKSHKSDYVNQIIIFYQQWYANRYMSILWIK